MAKPRSAFLLLPAIVGLCLTLGLAPGCSGNNPPAPTAAIIWTVAPGTLPTNDSSHCGAVNDVWTIGDPEANPIVTVSDGKDGVSVSCDVAQDSTGFNVTANAKNGTKGSLTISGHITASGSSAPGKQTNISGNFNDQVGLISNLSDPNCTVTFTNNAHMGIAPTRIWGFIDCPAAHDAAHGSTCDANAEFLFENCGQ